MRPKFMREVFVFPELATPGQQARAVEICQQCPIRLDCARAAIKAGNSVTERWRSPGVNVIMGGVYLDGSEASRRALQAVAGEHVPEPGTPATRAMIRDGDTCKGCLRPLWKWTREHDEIPAGHVMHYARGWCVECRGLYRDALARRRRAHPREYQRLGKPVDRKRHHPETAAARAATAERRRAEREATKREATKREALARHHQQQGEACQNCENCRRCENCQRPMVSRTRKGDTPAGHARHNARGYCTECWAAYRQAVKRDRRTQLSEQEGTRAP